MWACSSWWLGWPFLRSSTALRLCCLYQASRSAMSCITAPTARVGLWHHRNLWAEKLRLPPTLSLPSPMRTSLTGPGWTHRDTTSFVWFFQENVRDSPKRNPASLVPLRSARWKGSHGKRVRQKKMEFHSKAASRDCGGSSAAWPHRKSWVWAPDEHKLSQVGRPVIPALKKQRQEGLEFKVILKYIKGSRLGYRRSCFWRGWWIHSMTLLKANGKLCLPRTWKDLKPNLG